MSTHLTYFCSLHAQQLMQEDASTCPKVPKVPTDSSRRRSSTRLRDIYRTRKRCYARKTSVIQIPAYAAHGCYWKN